MRGFRSLYFKLLAAFGVTFLVLLITLGAGISGGFSETRNSVFQKNLRHYAGLLAQEIGVPPDAGKAAALSAELGVDIRWAAPGEELPPRPGRQGFRATLDGWTFSVLPRVFPLTPNLEGLLWALPGCALVLLASWALLRRLLSPLKQMAALASSLGVSDWKARIPVKGKDELASLAATFNAMADRIEGYWTSQQALLAAVSHELRSPLTRMRVALEFVSEEKIRESLRDDILRLDRMTGILLERERLGQRPDLLVLEPTNFPLWLDEVLVPFEKGGLVVERTGPPVTAVFDRSRMGLVVSNLLENILKHAPGSPAAVRWSPGPGLTLSVEDRGPGLPPEAWPHWGQPFRGNLDPRRAVKDPGFGLGSSLVKSIVEAHGGTVSLRQNHPQGLVVEVHLPGPSASPT